MHIGTSIKYAPNAYIIIIVKNSYKTIMILL